MRTLIQILRDTFCSTVELTLCGRYPCDNARGHVYGREEGKSTLRSATHKSHQKRKFGSHLRKVKIIFLLQAISKYSQVCVEWFKHVLTSIITWEICWNDTFSNFVLKRSRLKRLHLPCPYLGSGLMRPRNETSQWWPFCWYLYIYPHFAQVDAVLWGYKT